MIISPDSAGIRISVGSRLTHSPSRCTHLREKRVLFTQTHSYDLTALQLANLQVIFPSSWLFVELER